MCLISGVALVLQLLRYSKKKKKKQSRPGVFSTSKVHTLARCIEAT